MAARPWGPGRAQELQEHRLSLIVLVMAREEHIARPDDLSESLIVAGGFPPRPPCYTSDQEP